MSENETFKRRNTCLLVAYIGITGACLLPAFGIAFNSAELVLGVPLSVLWLTVCFTALAGLTACAYPHVFRLWSDGVDSRSVESRADVGGER